MKKFLKNVTPKMKKSMSPDYDEIRFNVAEKF